MAEGIYYYDETAPLTRSHSDVLHYQRPDQTPATYLVELPGTLPQPPPEIEVHRGSRRGTSIVKMDRPTSEKELEDLDPLEAYERSNLASFRKSLGPEDLRDAGRGRGSSPVNYKTAESGRSPAVIETVSEDSRRPAQNEKPTFEQMRRHNPQNLWPADADAMRKCQGAKPAEIETSRARGLVCSNDKGVCTISESEHPDNELQPTTQRETRNSYSDKKQENTLSRKSHQNETPTGKNKRKSLNENPDMVKMRKTPANETPAITDIRNAHPKLSENKAERKSTVSESLEAKIRQEYLNENQEYSGKMWCSPVNVTRAYNTHKEYKTNSFDPPPLASNGNHDLKQDANENEWNRANPTAIPMLTDPGGQDNGWAPKWDPYVCPDKRRGSDPKHSAAKSRDRKLSHYQSSSQKSTTHPLNCIDMNGKGKESVKRAKNFEESRLKVDLTVELLDDSGLVESKHIKNDDNHTSSCSGENEREREPLSNNAEMVRQRPNFRSWSADSRRESIDRSYVLMKNGRLLGGANSHRRSRSASVRGMKTENMDYTNLNLATNKKPTERKGNTLNKKNLNNFSRKNSLGSLRLDDVNIYSDRVYGGYDGKRKDQSPTNNKTGKPFNYDGMINCDIEDCPCRCHPDYDHSGVVRPGIARDRDNKDGTRGKGYDSMYDGDPYGRGRPGYGRGKDYPGKGYDPYYDGDRRGKGIPRDGRDRDFTGKGYDPDGRPRDGRGRDYPGKGYDPYDVDPDGKGRPKDGRGRDYPGKGYDPDDGGPDGKGRPKDSRDRDYPVKGYDPYDGDPYGKGRPKDSRGRDYPGKGYDPLFDENEDDRARPRDVRDGSLPGKAVGFRPGDRSPYRGDPTQGDGRGARGDKDAGGKGVLKQRVPKTATSLFTYKRYHIQIPDHNLKEPWFNARFSINEDKNVDMKYQGPVKINNYYTSNRYE